ncbi:MAG: FAD-binding oxidoreductase [Acidobacteriota bacterium]
MTEPRNTNTIDKVINEEILQGFKVSLRGTLLYPGDDKYDEARKIFNGRIDRRPAMIVRCADSSDVVKSVNFARNNGLLVAIRGGGHNVAGTAVCDGGMVIDLSTMKRMIVDPERRTARTQPGLLVGEFDFMTQSFGLATTLGIISHTGIAGLTLGGGSGWLQGKYGMTCDNLISVEIVTADGRLLTASANENEDLFWGVRGGGGNFGIVTSFEYQLHPVGQVYGGMVVYELSQAKDVLRFYREFARESPDELGTMPLIGTSPVGNEVIAIFGCYSGSIEEGEKILKPLRTFGSPYSDLFGAMNYVDMQSYLDWGFPSGRMQEWKSSFLPYLSDEAIEVLIEYALIKPSPMSAFVLQHLHGAACRVGPTETAFPHRSEKHDLLIISMWTDPSESEKNITWTREFLEAMQPFLERGVYVNNLGNEGEARIRAAYGPNYERLVTIKNKYDPTNFFRVNQNIKPTV